jgi:hypothetical protein
MLSELRLSQYADQFVDMATGYSPDGIGEVLV